MNINLARDVFSVRNFTDEKSDEQREQQADYGVRHNIKYCVFNIYGEPKLRHESQ